MGQVISGIGGITQGLGGVKDIIGTVSAGVSADRNGVGTILQSLNFNMTSTITQIEKLVGGDPSAGGNAGALLKSFPADLTRLAYVAALEKAATKARGQGSFNVETAINDLWIALDAIRRGQQLTAPMAQNSNDLLQSLTGILQKMNETAGSQIQNLKP